MQSPVSASFVDFVVLIAFAVGLFVVIGEARAEPGPSDPPITAVEASRAMGVGINLGNTFDYPVHPTDAASAKAQVSRYAEAGFTNVRIPATWNDLFPESMIDGDGRIRVDNARFLGFEAAVDHALDLGLYVIINMHHEKWLKHHFAGADTQEGRLFVAAWESIAAHFADRSHRLMFEVINEPEGTQGDWVGEVHPRDPAALALTRELNQLGYDAIRGVPGNEKRIVLVAPNAMGNQGLIADVYPDPSSLPGEGRDAYLMATLHTYDPWTFCGQDGSHDVYLSQADPAGAMQRDIDGMVAAIAAWAETMPVGVHWGEYGIGRHDQTQRDHDLTRLYYRHLTRRLQSHGWGTSVWDDRGWFAVSSNGATEAERWPFGIKDALLEARPAD